MLKERCEGSGTLNVVRGRLMMTACWTGRDRSVFCLRTLCTEANMHVCVFVCVCVWAKKICSKLKRSVLVAMATAESTADVNIVSL